MKKIFCIIIVSLLMVSCATVLNKPYEAITIYTKQPSLVFHKNDTIKTINNRAYLIVKRNKKALPITVSTDSLKKSISIESKNSFLYWYNVFSNYGVGMLVDKNNAKRYSYPRRVYIDSKNNRTTYYSKPKTKGELYLHASLPHINTFLMKPENESKKANTGFFGITLGLDYYHKQNQFLNLGFTGVADLFVPIPAPVSIDGGYELMSSTYVSLSNNYDVKRFTLGYGICYAINTWNFKGEKDFDSSSLSRKSVKKRNNTFGLVFPAYFKLGEHFNIGVVYRPTFYIPAATNKFLYEDLISIDLAWKIRLKK